MYLIDHDDRIIKELLLGGVAGDPHEFLRTDTVVGDETNAPCRIRVGVILDDGKNLLANLGAVLGGK